MEDMLLERVKELKEERVKFNANKKKMKEKIKKLKEDVKKAKEQKEGMKGERISKIEESDYYIENIDLYQKLKMMENMELSIKIHKLRKEFMKLKMSYSKEKSQPPKVLVQENNGVDQRGQVSRDQNEQPLGNRKGKKGNDEKKKDKRKQTKNKKHKNKEMT